EPAQIRTAELERSAALPERREGIAVKLRERRAGKPFEIRLETDGVAAERIVGRTPREVSVEEFERSADQRTAVERRPGAELHDFHVRCETAGIADVIINTEQ